MFAKLHLIFATLQLFRILFFTSYIAVKYLSKNFTYNSQILAAELGPGDAIILNLSIRILLLQNSYILMF